MTMIAQRLNSIVRTVFEGNALDAATAAAVLPSTLTRLLTGSVVAPRLTTVQALSDAFGLPVGWLIGELSTAGAQAGEAPLAESFWLLSRYYGRRQLADREWLMRVAGPSVTGTNREAREIIKYFSKFRLLPDGGSELNVALSAVVDFSKEGGTAELEIFRSLAVLETNLLAAAVARLRKMGIRVADDKPTRNRK